MRKVPVLSLKKYINGNDSQKEAFSKELFEAFKEYGFVVIENHTIPEELLSKAYKLSKQLFDLPVEAKNKYHVVGGGGRRGYTPFGKEHAKDSKVMDLKEFWHVGRENSENTNYPENIWPSEIKEFRETFFEIYSELDAAGSIILQALAPTLGLKKNFLSSQVENGDSILRLLHYPPISEGTDPQCIRAAAHGDVNYVTLLICSKQPGLELLDKDGNWIPVESNPNNIIVNIGDMLEHVTGGVLPSTIHRVINPNSGQNISRYSLPFFIHPRSEVVLSCLNNCKDDGSKHPDITAHDFLMQRLKEIGLKK